MAIFADLSPELIMGIWDCVINPDDIESFALVSKNIYSLGARDLKEHKYLKELYSVVRCDESGRRPAMEVEILLLHPRIALYVREISIVSPDVDSDRVCEMLPDSIRLESFIYDNGGVEESGEWKPVWICHRLLESSQHSLQRLVLYQDDVQYMGDITQFTRLTELETYFDLLLTCRCQLYHHLAEVLPSSIEKVALLVDGGTDTDFLRKELLEVIRLKADRVPRLKSLIIGFEAPDDWFTEQENVICELQGAFEEVGAVLEWSNALRSHSQI